MTKQEFYDLIFTQYDKLNWGFTSPLIKALRQNYQRPEIVALPMDGMLSDEMIAGIRTIINNPAYKYKAGSATDNTIKTLRKALPFGALPNELVERTLDFFDDVDAALLRRVCRTWNNYLRAKVTPQQIQLSPAENLTNGQPKLLCNGFVAVEYQDRVVVYNSNDLTQPSSEITVNGQILTCMPLQFSNCFIIHHRIHGHEYFTVCDTTQPHLFKSRFRVADFWNDSGVKSIRNGDYVVILHIDRNATNERIMIYNTLTGACDFQFPSREKAFAVLPNKQIAYIARRTNEVTIFDLETEAHTPLPNGHIDFFNRCYGMYPLPDDKLMLYGTASSHKTITILGNNRKSYWLTGNNNYKMIGIAPLLFVNHEQKAFIAYLVARDWNNADEHRIEVAEAETGRIIHTLPATDMWNFCWLQRGEFVLISKDLTISKWLFPETCEPELLAIPDPEPMPLAVMDYEWSDDQIREEPREAITESATSAGEDSRMEDSKAPNLSSSGHADFLNPRRR